MGVADGLHDPSGDLAASSESDHGDPKDAAIDEAIAGARPDDPTALALARARIERTLFGDLAPGFGRFRVLERLGEGGMGVVYSAYDPQLDRAVALKMIQVGTGEQAAALSEAKALAKLTHPNVVPVFDVGTERGRVYIVMELVRGATLREWCAERSASEIVEAYRQAGAGLAAAHEAGLIHRDVKPDNLLVGDDRRVRVVDFGLACEASAAHGRGAGTPKYMAPEQKNHEGLTPAVDQYGFCVSLAESLGESPPRWIAAVLERGMSAAPESRYPSMHELVGALGRDPARTRRRRILVASLLAIVVTGIVLVRSRTSSNEICSGGDAEIAAAWAPAQQAMVLGRASALGAYGKELATKLESQLASHATTWVAEHRAACLDHRRGAHSDDMFDRRVICLDRGRIARSELGRIATSATVETLPNLALAAASLPDPRACSDREQLTASVALPPAHLVAQVASLRDDIERARVMVSAGEFVPARDALRDTIARARQVAYDPILAEALLVDGHAAMSTDHPDAALVPLREATTISFRSGAVPLAIEAWARRAFVEGNFDNLVSAVAGSDVIEALAASASTAHFGRALLENNLASLAWLAGRRDEARERIARAEQIATRVTGAGAIELLVVHANSLVVADDPTQIDHIQQEVVGRLTEALGVGHPLTLWNRYLRATVTMSSPRAALVELRPVCEAMEAHSSLPERSANCWAEVAELHDVLDERSAAIVAAERSAMLGETGIYPELPGYLAWWRGDPVGALRLLDESHARTEDRDWYDEFHRLRIELARGRVLHSMKRHDATQILQTVLAGLQALPIHATTIARRCISQAEAALMEAELP
ncbi:MAG: protein kinase domain-containing protein [Kofleriaceae bacterium]